MISPEDNPIIRLITEGFETYGKYYSIYRAIVIDNEDPLDMGRLKVLVPLEDDKQPLPSWAYPIGMKGGRDSGYWDIPSKGELVWIQFEFGQLSHPVWQHCGYAVKEKPEEFKTLKHKGYKTPGGTLILINDNKEEEEILYKLNSGTDWVKINKDVIETESKLIKLGVNQEEHALMGDTTKTKIEEFMDNVTTFMEQYISHTHNTPFGPTSPPILASQTTNTKAQLEKLKGTLEEILSYKVSIDKGEK